MMQLGMKYEWNVLCATIPKFQGYIGFIDGMLIKIHKPYNDATHDHHWVQWL
jgi:hypothetical protein